MISTFVSQRGCRNKNPSIISSTRPDSGLQVGDMKSSPWLMKPASRSTSGRLLLMKLSRLSMSRGLGFGTEDNSYVSSRSSSRCTDIVGGPFFASLFLFLSNSGVNKAISYHIP
jgi:hypothetical protein